MINLFSMVSGASAALGAKTPLLSAVALWVGGLLTHLLHDLSPAPRFSELHLSFPHGWQTAISLRDDEGQNSNN